MLMEQYRKYALSRVFSVNEIVTIDLIRDMFIPELEDLHLHEEAWEFVYCEAGIVKVFLDGECYILHDNECIFIRPGTMHDVGVDSNNTSAFVASFTVSNGDIMLPLMYVTLHVGKQQDRIIRDIIYEIRHTYAINSVEIHLLSFEAVKNPPFGSEQIICSYLEQFIIFMLREITGNEGSTITESGFQSLIENYLIRQADDYIRYNYTKDISIGKIAERFHYSRSRFTILFHEQTGINPGKLISELRIQKAKELLLSTDIPIMDISSLSGFASPAYFTNKFTKEVGISPSEFRKKNK